MRHEPSANLAGYLLEIADDLERIAATSGNLKGTYVRRLRDDDGKARASATELVKRTSAAGANVALEQEILQLRARLQQATEENAELKKRGPLPETNEAGRGNQTTAPPKRQPQEEIHPKPPKQEALVCPRERANDRTLSKKGKCKECRRKLNRWRGRLRPSGSWCNNASTARGQLSGRTRRSRERTEHRTGKCKRSATEPSVAG